MTPKLRKYARLVTLLWICLLGAGCNATKFVPEGSFLLKNEPKIKQPQANKIDGELLASGVQSKPNRRWVLPKTPLHIHNFGVRIDRIFYPKREDLTEQDTVKGFRKFTHWLQFGFGEPPALVDSAQIQEDLENLRNICFANGHFYPDLSVAIDTPKQKWRKPKASLIYTVTPNTGYQIDQVDLIFGDSTGETNFARAVYDLNKSLLKPGKLYSHADFAAERNRVAQNFRNRGYFRFSPSDIIFEVDTSGLDSFDMALLDLDHPRKPINIQIEISKTPIRYMVREIRVRIKEPPQQGTPPRILRLRPQELTIPIRDSLNLKFKRMDSTLQETFLVDSSQLSRLNYNFLAQRIHLRENRSYSLSWTQLTFRRLQELTMLKYSLIRYPIVGEALMDVDIELQMAPQYQIQLGTETFTRDITSLAANLPSIGANITVRNRNTFKKSELLEVGVSGNIGWTTTESESGRVNDLYYQLGGKAELNIQRFLGINVIKWAIPKSIKRDFSRFSPTTILSLNADLERQQDFSQFAPGANMSYRWNHIPFKDLAVSRLTLISLDYIQPDVSSGSDLDTLVTQLPPPLDQDFSNRLSSKFTYSYTRQNYMKTRARPTYWYRITLENGGFLPYLIEQLNFAIGRDDDLNDNQFLLFDNEVFYGQYFRGSLEGKIYYPITKTTEAVFRGYIGAGSSYNKTPIITKDGRFFGGGISGMRGWPSKTLGPGRVGRLSDLGLDDSSRLTTLFGPGGEYKLELNAEYRFNLISWFEMALFLDMGNVWFSKKADEFFGDGKASLRKENLVLGVDAGLGFRFDFSFLIVRLDFGQQLFAPDLEQKWVFNNPEVERLASRRQFNLGIGYPF
ncbi:BamA/TamA family outer membrane protein [Pontibacter sp. G13]|uniref:translocation and assembly module lipoprotein TamL n=1 Tax=Pontibacter sp. G13 TaxID=3074898 RepID=UPI0028891538|nr:BamA/TamA family outer membrane protein [Pontibacter sp. G13]WNJ18528.1 BamA/TamA family outer membrane protein [Pontibacter sp. G13]